jgi:hypothetical protein
MCATFELITRLNSLSPCSILLTSSWVNTALFVGEICLAMYFLMHWRASRYQKLCIYPALVVDLAGTCLGYVYVYTVRACSRLSCVIVLTLNACSLSSLIVVSLSYSSSSGMLQYHHHSVQPDPLNVFWALPVINFGTIVNGATTEIFLIYRYWTLYEDLTSSIHRGLICSFQ